MMEDFSPHNHFRFPDEPDAIELRAFTHGLQPATVPDMMAHFTEDWRRFGVDAWNEVPNHWRPESDDSVGWWTLPTYLGDEFIAPLLGAPEGTCILQPHVHWTVQCLLSAPEVRDRGSEIVLPDTAFPSVLHSVQQWDDLQSFEPTIVPSTDENRVDREALLDAITDDTAMVAISHVGFSTGERLPNALLRRVADCARTHDALALIDGYHAAGSMPVDVTALGCDCYVGGLLKEGCGSSGNAFLYVRDGLELTPRLTGWFGDAAPFEFRQAPEPHPDVRRRFLGGTTAVAPLYHAVEGVRLLLDLGLDAVRQHSLRLSALAIERADAADLSLRSPRRPEARSAMILLEVPDAHKLTASLKEHNIYTDSRQNEVVRMAPFLWNTEAEIHRTFDQIEDALATGDYRNTSVSASGPVP
jgi:kynureninase